MNWKNGIKRIIVAFGVFVGLLAILVAIVVIPGMTIRLDFLRPAIEKGASEAMGRPVKIQGTIELIPSLRPTVTVSGMEIGNPTDWPQKQVVSVAMARAQIDILDLFARKISIGEITADGVVLQLISDDQGRNNWIIAPDGKDQKPETNVAETEKIPPDNDAPPDERGIIFTSLDRLSLTNIVVHYHDAVMNKTLEFRIDDFSGSARAGDPIAFELQGSLQGHAYRFRVDGGPLERLRDKTSAWPLKLSGDVVGTPVEATGELDRAADEPILHLGFALGKVDIGAIMAWLKIADRLDAFTERFEMDARLVGDSLHELIASSQLGVTLKGGQWTLQDPNTGAKLPVEIVDGGIMVAPEEPISLEVNGKIDQTPVAFIIQGTSLAELVNQPEAMTVHIGADAAGANLTLDGRLALPIHRQDASLEMTFEGASLDSLEKLVHVDLPPFGPYRLNARFAIVKTGYELSNLHLKVGSSQLDGTMKLNTSGAKPLTEVQLTSKRLQLDDFSTAGWELESRPIESVRPVTSTNEHNKSIEVEKSSGLLSPEVLNDFDAAFTVEVAQVLSGKDQLGGGMLKMTIENGRFSVDPLRLDVPGGSVQVGFGYHPTATDATVHLSALIDQFDVGVLVRRVDPEKKLGGLLSVDVELDGTTPDLRHLLANTNGHVDFAFWPENLDAAILDLWAVNVLTILSEQVDDEPSSTLNCMVARFGLVEGVMQEESIFMDTTRMSVNADATIDFKVETIDVLAEPKGKRPEYFSLATPVKIQGTFTDFGIGVNKLSIAKTAVSFITSPISVTIKRLFAGEVPADGQAACEKAWRMDYSDE